MFGVNLERSTNPVAQYCEPGARCGHPGGSAHRGGCGGVGTCVQVRSAPMTMVSTSRLFCVHKIQKPGDATDGDDQHGE